MNINEIRKKVFYILVGVALAIFWFVYLWATGFNFYSFIRNPIVWAVSVVMLLPIAYAIAEKIKV